MDPPPSEIRPHVPSASTRIRDRWQVQSGGELFPGYSIMARMKRLIVCFDGTWNSADSGGSETHVPRIARAISASSLGEGTPQLTLYLRGGGSTGIALQPAPGGLTGEAVD